MKIAICAVGTDLSSQVSPVFGRCPYYLIVDTKTKKFKSIANSAFESGRGAGVAASQTVISEGAKAVVCGNFGPNAFSVLQMSGIKIYSSAPGLTAKEIVEQFNKGKLKEMKAPVAPSRFGFGRGAGGGRGFGRGIGGRRRGF
ncbi:MAG: dinitrogenase iron-molybdenum cofactor biosynthesis protein [Thermoplasmata archaeon]|nr:MAG: dinitrogenase iron-molybdenum cofactor biosynthesis protein [Thermoplasmata archaeon]